MVWADFYEIVISQNIFKSESASKKADSFYLKEAFMDLNMLNKEEYRRLMASIGYEVMREVVKFGAPKSLLKTKKTIQAGEAILAAMIIRLGRRVSSREDLFFALSQDRLLVEAIKKTDHFYEILPYYQQRCLTRGPGW